MYEFFNFLTIFSIVAVMPSVIVWLLMRTRQNETNKKAEIMLKAIESGIADTKLFLVQQDKKTIKERLLIKLTAACILTLVGIPFLSFGIFFACTEDMDGIIAIMILCGGALVAVGIALIIAYFISKKTLAKEIEAEERSLEQK